MTSTLQTLSLVEKVEPVQVHFILRLWDQWSIWLQDGCKVYMASNGSCFMVTWIIFRNHLLEVGLTQNWETMALWTLIIVDLFYIYHVWGPTWIEIHWNSIWLRAWSHMASSHHNWGSTTTLHDLGGGLRMAFGHFLLGSHNFMVTALGSWFLVVCSAINSLA
jgi:hypothetical protein